MSCLAWGLGILFAGSILCLLTAGRTAWTRIAGPAITLAGCLCALLPAMAALSGGADFSLRMPWQMPYGTLALQLDALSAVFAVPLCIVVALSAVYGAEYLRSFEGKKDLAYFWCGFNLLAGSMLLVLTARNGILFLLAWELMSLSSFFLVMFESDRESVRRAGWTYLVATHIGTAFLLVLFALLGRHGGTLDFDGFSLAGAAPGAAGAAFLMAVIGFGTKAGFMPLHVWLPEAHPAAPSHVSAVMSGMMIKTGIYGLVRSLTYLGTPPPWWGWCLVGIGAVSGILGILFALTQRDLKRLLAYSSVENIGIITLGLGVGLLGVSYERPVLAFLGFAGALLHVINHAVFKSLLFLGAGSVLHASGTREIDQLGGLLKRMPVTGLTFLVGAAAICGLPPLNGFLGEFLIYLGSFDAIAALPRLSNLAASAGLVVIGSLALIGGLAVACFTKAFGILFLGEPRTEQAAHAHEAGPAMRVPMLILAAACVLIGLSGPFVIEFLKPAVAILTGGFTAQADTAWVVSALWKAAAVSAGLLVLSALLAWLRFRLLAGREVTQAVTWDCGYAAPTPRMQYTASSFANPLARVFGFFLRTRNRLYPPAGLFPTSSSLSTETLDVYREHVYRPFFALVNRFLARFRWLQHGRLNLYILYIVLALFALLGWKLR